MKETRFCLLIITLLLLSFFGASLAYADNNSNDRTLLENVLSGMMGSIGGSIIGQNCKPVATTDFHGTVCSYPDKETRRGIWVNENGGVFSGEAAIYTSPDKSQHVYKSGRFMSSTFDGLLKYEEVKDASGRMGIKERKIGRERMTDGGVFDGDITFYKNIDNSQGVIKGGRLITPTFDGTLTYEESRDASGRVASREIKNGLWRVSPTLILKGPVTTYVNSLGNYTVVDERK
ncbi:MAG: hypothetical protein NC923_04230 [Candidatus Omnitrophica bacterium]|nr:hypothetical protein [Candidatus Omnitrophota bacterium]